MARALSSSAGHGQASSRQFGVCLLTRVAVPLAVGNDKFPLELARGQRQTVNEGSQPERGGCFLSGSLRVEVFPPARGGAVQHRNEPVRRNRRQVLVVVVAHYEVSKVAPSLARWGDDLRPLSRIRSSRSLLRPALTGFPSSQVA